MLESLSIVFIAFGGFLLSLFLFHKKRRKSEPFVCPLHGKCSEVIHSDYSRFLGIHVEILGLAYYALVALGHGVVLGFPQTLGWLNLPLLIASSAAFLFSMYLTFIQVVALRKLCTWCLLSAMFCLLIFGVTVLSTLDVVLPFLVEYRSVILVLHVLAMALGLGAATLTDIFFFKFLKDSRISEDEAQVLSTLSETIWLALGVSIITGTALFLPDAASYLETPKFLAKLVVIVVIVLTGSFLNLYIAPKLVKISFAEPHHHKEGELGRARRIAFALGSISIVSWYCAFILGSLPATTPFSFFPFLKIYLLLLVVAVTIGQFVENRLSHRGIPWTTR